LYGSAMRQPMCVSRCASADETPVNHRPMPTFAQSKIPAVSDSDGVAAAHSETAPSIHRTLERLRRRARRALWLHGLSGFIAAALSSLLVAGLIDWLLRPDSLALRILLTLAVSLSCLWAAWHFAFTVLRTPVSDFHLALALERRYRVLRDMLVSSVQFAASGFDAELGSPELQRNVTAEAGRRLEPLDLTRIVSHRAARRMTIAAATVSGVWLSLLIARPDDVRSALHRLIAPCATASDGTVPVLQTPKTTRRKVSTRQQGAAAVAASRPTATVEIPNGDLRVTRDAIVPVRVVAQDDVGIHDMRILFRRCRSSEAASEQLDVGTDSPAFSILASREDAARRLVVAEYNWDLSQLELAAPSLLLFQAEVTGGHDAEPHVGRSRVGRLTVVSNSRKLADIAARQAELLESLDRLRSLQQRLIQQVQSLKSTADGNIRANSQTRRRLERTRIEQRELAGRLTVAPDSFRNQVRDVCEELVDNRIDAAELAKQLKGLDVELEHLESGSIPAVDAAFSEALRTLAAAGEPTLAGQCRESLDQAEQSQLAILAAMDRMTQPLRDWRTREELLEQARALIRRQNGLVERTTGLSGTTLSRSVAELTEDERTDLQRLADEQRMQARRTEELESQIERSARAASMPDKASSHVLPRVSAFCRQAQIPAGMHRAAIAIAQNHIGQALTDQREALTHLDTLAQLLTNRRKQDRHPKQTELQETAPTLVNTWIGQQQTIRERTSRLDQQHQEQTIWTRSQLKNLVQIAEAQHQLSQQVEGSRTTLPEPSAVASVLMDAAEAMQTAASRLKARQTDVPTQKAQEQALHQLQSLVALLRSAETVSSHTESERQPPGPLAVATDADQTSPRSTQTAPSGQTPTRRDGQSGPDTTSGAVSSSQPQAPSARSAMSDPASRQFLRDHFWGHLPASLRQQMFDTYPETLPAEYRDLIRRYYESLAEP